MTLAAERPLRSNRVKSGFAVAMAARVVRFVTNLVLARAVILHFGAASWGVLALSWAVGELIVILDFAIHELCVYEAASSPSRESAQRSLDQALLLCALPVGLGTLALLGCAAASSRGIGFGADYAGPSLTQLFLAAAAAYPMAIASKVYTGTLQGFGWIRELNLFALATIVIDLGVVLGGLEAGFGIVGVQWLRSVSAPLGLLIVVYTVRGLGLPVARPAGPDRETLKRMLRYAVKYNLNRGLGSAIVSCNAPIAQHFVPAAQLGAFGAADQWAGKLRKFTEIAWESLFHRLARCFRKGASSEEREAGRLQFLAVSLGMNLFLVPAGVLLILMSPWLFRHWLDARHAALPVALLPGLVAAWVLHASGSTSACAILASSRFGTSAKLHGIALVVNVVLAVSLTRIHGITGAVEAMVVSNGLLGVLLSIAACRLTGSSWWRWIRSHSVPYIAAVAALSLRSVSDAPWATALAIAISVGASVALGFRAKSLRSLREILRGPVGAS